LGHLDTKDFSVKVLMMMCSVIKCEWRRKLHWTWNKISKSNILANEIYWISLYKVFSLWLANATKTAIIAKHVATIATKYIYIIDSMKCRFDQISLMKKLSFLTYQKPIHTLDPSNIVLLLHCKSPWMYNRAKTLYMGLKWIGLHLIPYITTKIEWENRWVMGIFFDVLNRTEARSVRREVL
jgi:hypothetical protein